MADISIGQQWEEFITEYQDYFPHNPAIIKSNKKEKDFIV